MTTPEEPFDPYYSNLIRVRYLVHDVTPEQLSWFLQCHSPWAKLDSSDFEFNEWTYYLGFADYSLAGNIERMVSRNPNEWPVHLPNDVFAVIGLYAFRNNAVEVWVPFHPYLDDWDIGAWLRKHYIVDDI